MPGTVDDFIQRFGSQQTMDDREAAHVFDRFASDHPDDRDFDNQEMYSASTEYLGKLPETEFQQAARNAYASASPSQQQGLVGSIMRALQGRGVDQSSLAGILGQGNSIPSRLDPDQYARLSNYARQRHPDAMQEVVREQPWFMKAMGNPVVMGVLGMVASRMISNRTRPPAAQRATRPGGLLGKLF